MYCELVQMSKLGTPEPNFRFSMFNIILWNGLTHCAVLCLCLWSIVVESFFVVILGFGIFADKYAIFTWIKWLWTNLGNIDHSAVYRRGQMTSSFSEMIFLQCTFDYKRRLLSDCCWCFRLLLLHELDDERCSLSRSIWATKSLIRSLSWHESFAAQNCANLAKVTIDHCHLMIWWLHDYQVPA